MDAEDPGKRDERVAIYQDTSDPATDLDGAGQLSPNWSLVGTFSSEVIGEGGRELYYAQQVQSETQYVVKMLSCTLTKAINPIKYKFVWRSRTLNVIGVEDKKYRDNMLSFRCVEVDGQ